MSWQYQPLVAPAAPAADTPSPGAVLSVPAPRFSASIVVLTIAASLLSSTLAPAAPTRLPGAAETALPVSARPRLYDAVDGRVLAFETLPPQRSADALPHARPWTGTPPVSGTALPLRAEVPTGLPPGQGSTPRPVPRPGGWLITVSSEPVAIDGVPAIRSWDWTPPRGQPPFLLGRTWLQLGRRDAAEAPVGRFVTDLPFQETRPTIAAVAGSDLALRASVSASLPPGQGWTPLPVPRTGIWLITVSSEPVTADGVPAIRPQDWTPPRGRPAFLEGQTWLQRGQLEAPPAAPAVSTVTALPVVPRSRLTGSVGDAWILRTAPVPPDGRSATTLPVRLVDLVPPVSTGSPTALIQAVPETFPVGAATTSVPVRVVVQRQIWVPSPAVPVSTLPEGHVHLVRPLNARIAPRTIADAPSIALTAPVVLPFFGLVEQIPAGRPAPPRLTYANPRLPDTTILVTFPTIITTALERLTPVRTAPPLTPVRTLVRLTPVRTAPRLEG